MKKAVVFTLILALLMLIAAQFELAAANFLPITKQLPKPDVPPPNPPAIAVTSPTPTPTAETQTQNESLIVPALFGVFSAAGLVKAVGLLLYLKNRKR